MLVMKYVRCYTNASLYSNRHSNWLLPKSWKFPLPVTNSECKSTLSESANTYVSGSSSGSWSFYPSGPQIYTIFLSCNKLAERSPGVTLDKVSNMAENHADAYERCLAHISTQVSRAEPITRLSCFRVRIITAVLHNGSHKYEKKTKKKQQQQPTRLLASKTDVLEFIMNKVGQTTQPSTIHNVSLFIDRLLHVLYILESPFCSYNKMRRIYRFFRLHPSWRGSRSKINILNANDYSQEQNARKESFNVACAW